ncbi:MAG: AGE family epimerase/isomerase [Halobacteriaceae archaeon]
MNRDVLDGDFWREHTRDLIELWHEHAPDEEAGAFHLALDREWEPIGPRDKIPRAVSRHVFSFSSAYMLTGDGRYLDQARRGVDYLLDHAWDEEYGGWFDRLTREGEPKEPTKTASLQLYTNVGLTQYYLATGDEDALERVRQSLDIRQTRGYDDEHGGYFDALNRDLSVADDGKNKHAHYGYVGSHTLNMYLATGDPAVLEWAQELADLSIERQMDDGWIYGFQSEFDREWELTRATEDGEPVVSVGAQLTAALAFLRLYLQSDDERYREAGMDIAENINTHGYDERGFFWDTLYRESLAPVPDASVNFWIQNYGCFLQLQLYNLTGDETYLDRFRTAEEFYTRNMVDEEYGGIFPYVDADGQPAGKTDKAGPSDTSYHEIEHGFLCSLYLDLYVDGEPATLRFRLDGGDGGRTHRVSPVDDPRVGIERVTVDGDDWTEFDADERSVTLPAGSDLDVAVTLRPVPGR